MGQGSTILQACEKVGIYIPRFCYSESLSIAGNCRMCLVEIEKSPKLMPACAIKVAPDMKIYTKTNLVKKTRESILEFLLINHPLDCPICDQGGECDSQDQAMIYGSDRGRFYEYKRSMEDKNGGPLIKTIMTRCIHCTRCIRFATEVAGIEVYGTSGRGKGMEVGTYISTLFNSELSGNVIDLCPVGALTSKPYAFTVRPWELKSIESIDVLDGIGSNIRIDIKGSELMRILPKANDLINQQWINDKTRFSYDGLKTQRLHFPMVKEENSKKFIPISWKHSLKLLKKKMNSYGIGVDDKIFLDNVKKPKMMGVIGEFIDQQGTLMFKKFFNKLGYSDIYLQKFSNKLSYNIDLDFRHNYLLNRQLQEFDVLKDKQDIDRILLIGVNPRYEASSLNVRLRQLFLRKNGSLAITSIGAPLDLTYEHEHIGNNINTLRLLAYGKHLSTTSFLFSKNPLSIIGINSLQRTDGSTILPLLNLFFSFIHKIRFNLFKSLTCNIQNNSNKSLVKRHVYSISKKTLFSLYDNIQTFIDLESCQSFSHKHINILHSYANTVGSLDLNIQPSKATKIQTTYNSIFSPRQDEKSLCSIQDLQCLYLLGATSASFVKNLEQVYNNIQGEKPFIIYQGHHGDSSTKYANIILPSTSYVEKNGTYVNTEGRVQQTQIAIPSESTTRDDWKILNALSDLFSTCPSFHTFSTNTSFVQTTNPLLSNLTFSTNQHFKPFDKNSTFSLLDDFNKHLAYSLFILFLSNNIKSSHTFFDFFNKHKMSLVSHLLCLQPLSTCFTPYHLFNTIAPHLNENNSLFMNDSSIKTTCEYHKVNLNSFSDGNRLLDKDQKDFSVLDTKKYIILNSNYIPLFDNFYLSNIISQSSVTMGKCSLKFFS